MTMRRTVRRRRHAQAGFMLVEMLVAMAVGAFLLVALASVTALVLRAHERSADRAENFEEASRTLAALSREIRTAAHVRWAGVPGDLVFAGAPDHLMFAHETAEPAGAGFLEVVRFESRGSAGRRSELLRSAALLPPYAASADALAWSAAENVYGGRFRMMFAYFGRLEGDGEALVDSWEEGDEMPVAVRVSLLTEKEGEQLYSIRIPLWTDAELGCALPKKMRCGPRKDDPAAGSEDAESSSIDPDDELGWERYVQ